MFLRVNTPEEEWRHRRCYPDEASDKPGSQTPCTAFYMSPSSVVMATEWMLLGAGGTMAVALCLVWSPLALEFQVSSSGHISTSICPIWLKFWGYLVQRVL